MGGSVLARVMVGRSHGGREGTRLPREKAEEEGLAGALTRSEVPLLLESRPSPSEE